MFFLLKSYKLYISLSTFKIQNTKYKIQNHKFVYIKFAYIFDVTSTMFIHQVVNLVLSKREKKKSCKPGKIHNN